MFSVHIFPQYFEKPHIYSKGSKTLCVSDLVFIKNVVCT